MYRSGAFDATLLAILENYQAVLDIILPTLGEARRQTYSPFLPLCPQTGRVLMVPVKPLDVSAGTITYTHPDTGSETTTPVTGGACKLQWKADWAMRWTALGVDHEMAGRFIRIRQAVFAYYKSVWRAGPEISVMSYLTGSSQIARHWSDD